jgi:ubiquinone/menaquinone biosynthesis C-methylase UbiE
MNKGKISNLLRKIRLLHFTDRMRFQLQRLRNRKINKNFRKQNPLVKLPPDYLIYESFQLNYKKYYSDSFETAKWLTNLFGNHIELKNVRILDWGCGPGRIIRHLPEVISNGCSFYGTDYNKKSINWCTTHLTNIEFYKNTLDAVLPYEDNFFDLIYGISVLTHLSEKMHYNWYQELYRILKSGGIMLMTTQGENFLIKMTEVEREKFKNQQLVVRGKVKEGHRTYSAFHPTGFMENLFSGTEILEHIVIKPENASSLPQDIWIIRKL